MATNPNSMVQEAVDAAISKRGEIGLQVVAYVDGKQVVDVWGGLADVTTGRQVDADTLFPVFSVTKAVTAVALHIQHLAICDRTSAERWRCRQPVRAASRQ
jgi:CubicO group peptidase (beta-lactamase class C family)